MGLVKTSLQEELIMMSSSSTYTTIFLIFLIASPILAAPEIKAVEDRTFCMSNAPTTCANSCAGVPCTQTCTVVCGFWYLYRRICSNVASSTCTTTTVATTTTTTAAATTTQ